MYSLLAQQAMDLNIVQIDRVTETYLFEIKACVSLFILVQQPTISIKTRHLGASCLPDLGSYRKPSWGNTQRKRRCHLANPSN